MAALDPGAAAPDFTLPTMDGKQFSLSEALTHGPVVAAFFKISCPTCQYAFPSSSGSMRRMETSALRSLAFRRMKRKIRRHSSGIRLTFPVLLDDTRTYQFQRLRPH